ncbi:carcinoembryonic antigen-related cell adhesion molecule 21-like isoform X2 [Loxodonta africana]|uniref:carcinoembryonic antigen-related cell adhesion molecule 21-like isoform X2 n=1 Tax=Loxodonta africana TaxID=9785 RepID=UPI000C812754|nr:carcinoembryonic antigen-related cell adhesion molecule 21-like isoform X2 [Loxodonta africana]
MRLPRDNSSVTVDPIKSEYAGKYQCEVLSQRWREGSESPGAENLGQGPAQCVNQAAVPIYERDLSWNKTLDLRFQSYHQGGLSLNQTTIKGAQSRQQRPMEPPSASPHRWRVHWHRSLLTVSLLIFWSPSITAQPKIESVPPHAAEGFDVLLALRNPPENIFVYIWYKAETPRDSNNRIVSYTPQAQVNDSGPAYTGRETIYHNGSLLIQNITRSNAGAYTLQMSTISGLVEARGQIRMHHMVTKPSIQASFTTVTENKGSVTLTCHSNHTEISFRWLFEGQSLQLTERTMLSRNHGALTIDPIKRWDAGEYQCEVYNPVSSSKSDPLVLAVKYDDSASRSGLSGGALAGVVVGVLAGVALIAALVCFLCIRNTGRPGPS